MVSSLSVWASSETRQAHSVARLISEEKVVAGQSFAVGLHLVLEEGWHSYWSNPGDAGTPPQFKWTLPEGVSVTGPYYSIPQRIEIGSAVSFGYASEAFYRFEVSQSNSSDQRPLLLILDAEWLVCEKTCVPAKHQFKLEIPRGLQSEPAPEAPLIARFQQLLPQDNPEMKFRVQEQQNEVSLRMQTSETLEVLDVFPASDWWVDLASPRIEKQSQEFVFTFKKKNSKGVPERPGIVVYRKPQEGSQLHAAEIVLNENPAALAGLLSAFAFAFLGGLLLNLMPCVFPVLSIKVFSVLEQAGKGKQWVRHSSLIYAAGILVSFMALGVGLAALRSWGEAVGWGFQLQNPYLLVVLIFLFLSLGVSFLGGIDLSWLQVGAGQSLANQAGWTGEFFSGVLCVVVASPCTAPFMGAALGYAIAQPLPILLTVFLSLGIGLAFPYLVLALFPQAARVLPRPGRWMETVKEAMAFPLFATVIWLLWILGRSSSAFAMIGTLSGILISGIGLWAHHHKKQRKIRWGILLGITGVLVSLWMVHRQMQNPIQASGSSISHGITWEAFSEERAAEASKAGKWVFVDFTASWCVTCQVNEEVTFGSAGVRDFIREKDIVMMKADWTKADPAITQALKSYQRIGVPYYVVYAPGSGKGRGLGEILTPKIFKKAFGES